MESNKTKNLHYKYLYSCKSNNSSTIEWKEFSETTCQLIETSYICRNPYIEFKAKTENDDVDIKINLKKMIVESTYLKGERVKRIPENIK
jgi:hypothetical protein